jgi:hypothetical protein
MFLYIVNYAGQDVLICRQLDDFIARGEDESRLKILFTYLATKINIVAEVGLVSHYNGIEVVHDQYYVKVHVGKYIEKILTNHGWEQVAKCESRLTELLHPSAFRELEETIILQIHLRNWSWNEQQDSPTSLL